MHRTWLFDCDGVILDSNRVKSEAMAKVTQPYGSGVSDAFVRYHQDHAGVSRYAKFDHLFAEILQREPRPGELAQLLDDFGALSLEGLLKAPLDPALPAVVAAIAESGGQAYVVSGGDEQELREIFGRRGLASSFAAIFGSPRAKSDIVSELMAKQPRPAVMVGDSDLDYRVAVDHGLDFVFVSHWTEMSDWESVFVSRPVEVVDSLERLLPALDEAAARA